MLGTILSRDQGNFDKLSISVIDYEKLAAITGNPDSTVIATVSQQRSWGVRFF